MRILLTNFLEIILEWTLLIAIWKFKTIFYQYRNISTPTLSCILYFQLTMTIEKSLARPTSPVHVHVDDDTPVHVHVKKPGVKKTKPSDVSKATVSLIPFWLCQQDASILLFV